MQCSRGEADDPPRCCSQGKGMYLPPSHMAAAASQAHTAASIGMLGPPSPSSSPTSKPFHPPSPLGLPPPSHSPVQHGPVSDGVRQVPAVARPAVQPYIHRPQQARLGEADLIAHEERVALAYRGGRGRGRARGDVTGECYYSYKRGDICGLASS